MGWPGWMQKFLPAGVAAPAPTAAAVRTAAQQALLEELELHLPDRNVQAFLRVIRAGETSQDEDAYRYLFGSEPSNDIRFDGFDGHPKIAKVSKWGNTSAAGAYQAMCAIPAKTKVDTWGDFIKAVGPMRFTPHDQDLFAVWCIRRRGALRDVLAGDLVVAIQKVAAEWASLPGSPYGQPTITLNRCGVVFKQYGGVIRGQA